MIEDGIFDFDRAELAGRMPAVLEEASGFYGAKWAAKKDDFRRTLEEEFPTGFSSWSAALARGGFAVAERWRKCSFYGKMLARKER